MPPATPPEPRLPSACPPEDLLRAFQLGTLPEDRLDEVTAHLEQCAPCEDRTQALDAILDPFLASLREPGEATDLDSTCILNSDTAHPEPATGNPVPATSFPKVRDYEILEVLGRGGMAIVYKARQTALNRIVALKMIHGGASLGSEGLTRLRHEAEAVARLHHPNLVQIFDVVRQDGELFLALEYVSGGNLDQYLAGEPQLPRRAAELVETLARAVDHAHERGILHRDLKPANVLLAGPIGPEGPRGHMAGSLSPKITDFGLAKQLGPELHLTQTGSVMGTPAYMAPEQTKGDSSQLGPAVDVYSLGVILYEMLTGRVPFRGASAVETLLLVRTQEPVPPTRLQAGVPRDLETICLKCLEKEPRRRYRSAGELADDLRRFLDGRPVSARPARPWERAWKWSRRQPLAAGLLAGVVLTAAVGLAAVLAQWRTAVRERDRAEANEVAANDARGSAESALQAVRAEQAIKRQRGRQSAPLFLGDAKASAARGQLDYALAQAGVALDFDPELAEARLVRGQVQAAQKEWAAARAELEPYVRQAPEDGDAARLLGLCREDYPDGPGRAVALADVFIRQRAYGLAARVEQDTKRLLDIYRRQLDAAWPNRADLQIKDGRCVLNLADRREVKDLSPLDGLPIQVLVLTGCSQVRDLAPLRALPLEELDVSNTGVTDLEPLRGLRLTRLNVGGTRVNDLGPLAGMPLTHLNIRSCAVAELEPLRGLPLSYLDLTSCDRVTDLAPLARAPLRRLFLDFSGVRDLTPLDGAPLEEVELPKANLRGIQVVRRMTTLKAINGRPTAEFWK
jgi:Protein kinase domain